MLFGDKERAAKERSLQVVMVGLRGLADLPPAPHPLGGDNPWECSPPWHADIRPGTATITFPEGVTIQERADILHWLQQHPTPSGWAAYTDSMFDLEVVIPRVQVAGDLVAALDRADTAWKERHHG